MKKSSEVLSQVQEQTAVRRKLLESGKIRLIPEKQKPTAEQEGRTVEPRKQSST